MTRTAVIGMGRWGKRLIEKFAVHSDLVLCCNQSSSDAHQWVQQHYPSVRASYDAEDAFRDDTIEAVAIATPIGTHADLALRAIESGKHVFVEKPLATSVPEAEEILKAARQAERTLFVGHVFLFHPILERLVELTRNDPVRYARMDWSKFGTFDEDLLWNLMSHQVSITLKLFGRSPDGSAILAQYGAHTSMDFVSAKLGFPDGDSCLVEADRCSPSRRRSTTVSTHSGKLFVWEEDDLLLLKDGSNLEMVSRSSEEPLVREVQAFIGCVEEGAPNPSDGDFGLAVVEVVARLDRLARPGMETPGAHDLSTQRTEIPSGGSQLGAGT